MPKLPRWLLLVLIPLLCCGVIPFSLYAIWFDPNFGCFSTFYPSLSQVGERANVRFPPSTANLEWRCLPGIEGDEVLVRFTVAPGDIGYVTNAPSYYPWNLIRLDDFFESFDDNLMTNKAGAAYTTWQGNSICGWTNVLVDIDDPKLYTVYAHYYDWDDCTA
jgi:hypothetical protein